MTIPSSRSLILWISVFSITSPSADFGRLRKTSDFFGNLRKWSCRLQSQHSQDKNLTLITQKKLAGILHIPWLSGNVSFFPPLAWENSRHLPTLPLVSPPNDVWEKSAEIPFWWRVSTQIWDVLLIGRAAWEIWFNQSEALPRSR